MSSSSSTPWPRFSEDFLTMVKNYGPLFVISAPHTINTAINLWRSSTDLLWRSLGYLKSYLYFDISEFEGVSTNILFSAVQLYLSNIAVTSGTTSNFTVSKDLNSSAFTFGLSSDDQITDVYNGVTVFWFHSVSKHKERESGNETSQCKFTLQFCRNEKDVIIPGYLDHIMTFADGLRSQSRERHLYTNTESMSYGGPWSSVPLKHPSTFDTLALDPVKKDEIKADLRDFAEQGRAFYQRTGRAWKRGYLLYGPPGTGKSSMIAAMANYLNYDIYDLELTQVYSNSELRNLLMKTTSKSIIVIEDIDCSVDLTKRGNSDPSPTGGRKQNSRPTITLSGLLNFTDGLWSCCGSERIFVFTTNHIENVDPALLRSGRMDMHIHMGNCSFGALKVLMKNYLQFGECDEVECDEMMAEVEGLIDEAAIAPADVSELLIKKRRREVPEAVSELLEELTERAKRRRDGEVEESNKEVNEKKDVANVDEKSMLEVRENGGVMNKITPQAAQLAQEQ